MNPSSYSSFSALAVRTGSQRREGIVPGRGLADAVALALISLAALASTPALAAGELQQAEQMIASGRSAEALQMVQRFGRTGDPAWSQVHSAALLASGQSRKAVELLAPVNTSNPLDLAVANNYAVALEAIGATDQARQVLERALGDAPSSSAAFRNLRSLYAKMAAASYARAVDGKAPQVTPTLALALPSLRQPIAFTPGVGTGAPVIASATVPAPAIPPLSAAPAPATAAQPAVAARPPAPAVAQPAAPPATVPPLASATPRPGAVPGAVPGAGPTVAAAQQAAGAAPTVPGSILRPGGPPLAAATPVQPAQPPAASGVPPRPVLPPLAAAGSAASPAPAQVSPPAPAQAQAAAGQAPRPPVAAEPPKPEKPAKPPVNDRQAIVQVQLEKATSAWANAWSNKDVSGYLGHYSRSFQPPQGLSRSEWEKQRRQRIDKPGAIRVEIDDFKVTPDGDGWRVTFRQNYKATGLQSSATKSMRWVHENGRWQIQAERAQ